MMLQGAWLKVTVVVAELTATVVGPSNAVPTKMVSRSAKTVCRMARVVIQVTTSAVPSLSADSTRTVSPGAKNLTKVRLVQLNMMIVPLMAIAVVKVSSVASIKMAN